MKVSKEKLKQMIKEELEAVMKESEADLEEVKTVSDKDAYKYDPKHGGKWHDFKGTKETLPKGAGAKKMKGMALGADVVKAGGKVEETLDEVEELDEVKAHDGAEEEGEHKGETKAKKAEHEKGESAAKEKAEHDKKKKEEAQMENLRESFRRFTKLPKATLKD